MTVRVEKNGPVWTVIHSRYEARNAMDPRSARELFEAFVEFDSDPSAAVAVFWGEGGAFCAGWDLKQAASLSDDDDGIDRLAFEDSGHSRAPMGPSRLALSKPVIAAVAGPAVAGGMELAMWADLRVMEETGHFVECFDPATNSCVVSPGCGLRHALGGAVEAFLKHLDGFMVSDLVEDADRFKLLLAR